MQTCSHIKADGALCRAIPMKNKTRCYFHQQTQTRQRQLRNNRMLPMPVIEDVPSIQLALMDIVNRLAQGTIEARNAGLILYALQIASSNLRTGRFTSKGWQDYQSKNAKLVRTEEIEERSQSASELLVKMLTARKEECMAAGPDPDLSREERIPFINASVAQPPSSAGVYLNLGAPGPAPRFSALTWGNATSRPTRTFHEIVEALGLQPSELGS